MAKQLESDCGMLFAGWFRSFFLQPKPPGKHAIPQAKPPTPQEMQTALSRLDELATRQTSQVRYPFPERPRNNVLSAGLNQHPVKRSKEWELITQAHASAVSALVNFLSRMAKKPIPADREDAQGQAALIAHFVQGIDLCKTAIIEGLYPQAATLLRQQHEIIAAVEEFSAGRRKDGKTPHATIGVLRDMGRVYGDLSGGAHVSHANLLKNFVIMAVGDKNGPSLLPIYHHEITRNLYALHVSYILMMLVLAGDVQNSVTGDTLNSDEVELHYIGRQILIDLGLIRFEEAPTDTRSAEAEGGLTT